MTPWRPALGFATRVWLVVYAAYAVLTLAVPGASWNRHDTEWYLRLAAEGYHGERAPAFFPLYPLLVRAAGGGLVAAMLVSAVAYLGLLVVLYRLVEREYGHVPARRALCWLAAFPTAFYLAAGYNMAVTGFLLVVAVYAMRHQHWAVAGVAGAFATASRASALLLVVVFLVECRRRPGRHLWWGALIPVGLLSYAAFLWTRYGDPLAFAHAQRSWGRGLDWPWVGFLRAATWVVAPPQPGAGLPNLLDLCAALLLVLTLLLGWRRLPASFLALQAGLTALAVSTPSDGSGLPMALLSVSRLALEAFPLFVLLGVGAGGRAFRLGVALSVTLQALFLARFLLGGFVA